MPWAAAPPTRAHGRVTGIYYVRNPEKLSLVESATPLTLR